MTSVDNLVQILFHSSNPALAVLTRPPRDSKLDEAYVLIKRAAAGRAALLGKDHHDTRSSMIVQAQIRAEIEARREETHRIHRRRRHKHSGSLHDSVDRKNQAYAQSGRRATSADLRDLHTTTQRKGKGKKRKRKRKHKHREL